MQGKAMRLTLEQFRQEPLALEQRLAPEVPAIKVEEVEGEQECVAGGARGERLLQRAKIRDPAMLDHGLAVEIRGANGSIAAASAIGGNLWVQSRPRRVRSLTRPFSMRTCSR